MENKQTTFFAFESEHLKAFENALKHDSEFINGSLLTIEDISFKHKMAQLEFENVLSAVYFGIYFERAKSKFLKNSQKERH